MFNVRLGSVCFDANSLWKRYPPNLTIQRKMMLINMMNNQYNESMSEHPNNKGMFDSKPLTISRYSAIPLPKSFPQNSKTIHNHFSCAYPFVPFNPTSYTSSSTTDSIGRRQQEFYVNFADRHLFGYYNSRLLAQDELMVAEMPILMSVREMLLDQSNPKLIPQTIESDLPTPYIIRNVERKIIIDLSPHHDRPNGLYGNNFSYTPMNAIKNAISIPQKPHSFHIIAMAAPGYGSNTYDKDTIKFILSTAFSSFRGALIESYLEVNDFTDNLPSLSSSSDSLEDIFEIKPLTIINTGNWGTGAFGGNHILMALLQIAAADLSGIDYLNYYIFSKENSKFYQEANSIHEKLKNSTKTVEEYIDGVYQLGFRWGVSNGT